MKLYILSNPLRDPDFSAAQKTAAICAEFGAEVILPPHVPLPAGVPGVTSAHTTVISEIRPDVVITLGGDGTLLRASHETAPLGIPMIGVNFGTVGFLTELDRQSLDRLKKLATGDYTIEDRMMLQCTLYRDGEPIYSTYALNDCIIARGETLRNISLTLYSDNTEIKSFSGDGLVVSTPTGSTAYSLSAGGPIVDPDASVFVITPVCAHALYAKSFVLSSFRTVRVVSDQSDGKAVRMSCDGVDSIPMYNGDIVVIERSDMTTKLIKLTDNDFFERLGSKLSER